VRIDEPIEVDGRLDERVWRETPPFELRFETRPLVNGEPPVRTWAWIAYDEERIYFAFRAEEPAPESIRARFTDRDETFNDDQVGVILDTFHDGRRAFEFFVNPLGVQSDILEDDITGGDDPSWDALWDSAGRLTETGFEVEGAVPFSSLRYPRTSGEQTWGFNAVRFWPRDASHRIALEPRDPGRNCILCQLADLAGITGLEPRLDVELDPTLTASRTERRDELPDGPSRSEDDVEVGLSARWGVTPNLSLNATINPDFSQVEADARQLDVNQRFALFFEEKRPFFLEGADLFDTELDVVHTRDVADPYWGLKLTGKEGPHALGVLAAEDRITNLLIPGAERSALDSIAEDNFSTLLRYRRDLPLTGSTVGVLYTGRQGENYENHVLGADALLRLGSHHGVRIEAFGSETEYPDEIVARHGQPAGSFRDGAFRLGYGYQTERWEVEAEYQDVGRDFRADFGFVPQVDFRTWALGAERIFRGESEDWYDELRFGAHLDETRDQAGRLLEREVEASGSFQGAYQSSLFVGPGYRERTFAGVDFEEAYLFVELSARPTSWLAAGLDVYVGDAIDFDNVRPADTLQLGPSLGLSLGRHWQIQVDHELEKLDVEGGELFRANLSRLAIVYQFDRRTQVRLLSQHVTVERDPTLYFDEVYAKETGLSNQLLFSWKLNPQTVVFAGYSDEWRGNDDDSLARSSRTYFLKLGYAWLP